MRNVVIAFVLLSTCYADAQSVQGVKPGISINGSPCLIQNLIYSCTPRTCDSIVITAGDSIEFCTYQQIFLNTDTAYWLQWNFYGSSNLPGSILNDYPSITPQCYFPRWDTAGTFIVEVFYNGVLSAYPTSDCYQQGPSHWYVKVVVLPDPNSIAETQLDVFKIVPNPSDGIFTIQIPHEEQITQVVITDISGRTMLETTETIIDLSAFERGTYFASISTVNSNFSRTIILR